jgi:hypothetical protein
LETKNNSSSKFKWVSKNWKLYHEKHVAGMCPKCQQHGLVLQWTKKMSMLFQFFWLWPHENGVFYFCQFCRHTCLVPSEDLKNLPRPKTPWHFFAMPIIMLLFVLVLVTAVMTTEKTTEPTLIHYLENPQYNDLYVVSYQENENKVFLILKVHEISPEGVTFLLGPKYSQKLSAISYVEEIDLFVDDKDFYLGSLSQQQLITEFGEHEIEYVRRP